MTELAPSLEPPAGSVEAAIVRYRETGDRAIRNQVVQEHWWLAMAVARQLKRNGEDLQDLAQVAMIGILKAIERFDPRFGASFRTYASATSALPTEAVAPRG